MYLHETAIKALQEHDKRTPITKKTARDQYGILTGGVNSSYRYYLRDDGTVVDNDGDVRYSPPPRTLSLRYCTDCRAYHTANSTPDEAPRSCDIPF